MSKEATGDVKGVISSALLLAAVVIVLVAGMMLKADAPGSVAPAADSAAPAPALPLGSTITQERAPAPPAEPEVWSEPQTEPVRAEAANPLLVELATRAEADCARLAEAKGRFTAQLLVACKPETVDRVLDLAGGSRSLYVLPIQVKDEPCFRVCFGTYASSKEASVASDLPKALRGKEKVGAVEIAKVLP